MKISINNFKGVAPKISPRSLPEGMGQQALNTRLLTTDLEAWPSTALYATLAKTGGKSAPINTIYRMDEQYWLYWGDSELADGADSVDVARGFIPSDITERTYFTGTSLGPRVTNISLATGNGSGIYPESSYALGVPAPTIAPNTGGAAFYTDDGTNLVADWTVHATGAGNTITQDGATGNPLPSYKLVRAAGVGTEDDDSLYMLQDLSIGVNDLTTINFDVRLDDDPLASDICVLIGADATSGGGHQYRIHRGKVEISTQNTGFGNDHTTPFVFNFVNSVPDASFFSVSITTGASTDGTKSVSSFNATYNGSGLVGKALVTHTSSGAFPGPNLVFKNAGSTTQDTIAYVDNVSIYASGNTVSDSQELTNYVYTYVNVFGEEGPPSPVSSNVVRPVSGDAAATVTVPKPDSALITSYGLSKINLYRAVTGSTGSDYLYITSGPITDGTDTVIVDNLLDDQLGEVLATLNYDLPPDDGQGIVATSNGIMFMFSKNDICPSVQFKPYAYPVDFRVSTDFPIVGMAAIDTTLIVLTEAHPYIVVGSTPDGLSMAKIEHPWGCSSKRSIATLHGLGVLYASPNGLIGITGAGSPVNLTDQFFSKREWLDINPSSIIAHVHQGYYFGWYTKTDNTTGGFIFDPKQGGFGWIWLSDYAAGGYVDRLRDCYFPLMNDNVYLWEGNCDTPMTYTWKSKLYLMPYPTNLSNIQVKAQDYSNSTLKIYGDGNLILTKTISGIMEFIGPSDVVNEFEIQLEGTSRIRQVEISDNMEELT